MNSREFAVQKMREEKERAFVDLFLRAYRAFLMRLDADGLGATLTDAAPSP